MSGFGSPLTATVCLLCLLCSACASAPPTRYYQLAAAEIKPPELIEGQSIGLRPVKLPQYLERNAIVLRANEFQLRYSGVANWADPLEKQVNRLLNRQLAAHLKDPSQLISFPWDSTTAPQNIITVTIERFDGDQAGTVRLDASWKLESESKNETTQRRSFEVTADPNDYGDIVRAHSQALVKLATAIVAGIRQSGTQSTGVHGWLQARQ